MSHNLPDPPPEPPIDQSLTDLAPVFRAKVESMLQAMERFGLDPVIAESTRSDERQAWLYGFGRDYDDGRGVVTNAPTGDHSWHKFGLAVDVISRRQGWDAPNTFWTMLGSAAHGAGLAWGGDWASFKDLPHVQMGNPMRQSPSSKAPVLWAEGKSVLWKEVDAL